MATPIKLKRSAVEGKRPGLSDLQLGELALNTNDGNIFVERDTGGVGIATTIANVTPWTENYGGESIYYNDKVGIGTTNPQGDLQIGTGVTVYGNSGIVSATKFYGDGSTLSNLGGTLNITADYGTGASIALATQNLTLVGTANEVNTNADGQQVTIGLPDTVNVSDLIVGVGASFVGIATFSDTLKVGTAITAHAGIISATKFVKSGGTSSQFLKANGDIDNSTYLSEPSTLDDVLGRGNVSGIGISVGISTLGKVSNGFVELYHGSDLVFQTVGTGVSISSGTGNTATIYGPDEIHIDPSPIGVGTTSGIVRIKGDLYVDGTEFIVNSETITLGDFVVGIATTATTDALTDGAGIGIGSIGNEKTFKYEYNSGINPSLKSSENLNVATGKGYQIAQTEVLSATTLGSGVTESSLTSVGILTTLDVNGHTELDNVNVSGASTFHSNIKLGDDVELGLGNGPDLRLYHTGSIGGGTTSYIDNYQGPLYIRNNVDNDDGSNIIIEAKSGKASAVFQDDEGVRLYFNNIEKFATTNEGINVTGIATATTFSGSGSSLTSIPNTALDNKSVSYGGVEVNLGSSDDTPAFNLSDATGYAYTSLTGIVTHIVGDTTPQLGGDLDGNSKSIDGIINLKATGITTVGFATATDVWVSGVVTATTFDGSLVASNLSGTISNSQLENDSVSYGGVSVDLGSSDATPAFNLTNATNYPYTSLTGIVTHIVGDTTPQLGGDLDGNSKSIYGVGILTATTFSGSGSSLTSIPNTALDNKSVSYGGVEVDLGSTDATPAFNLTDATNYPYTSLTGIVTHIIGDTTPQLGGDLDGNSKNISGINSVTATNFYGSLATTNLTGTITNAQLAGSIDITKLANYTVNYGGVSLDLGESDLTPAFDLADATNYPYTSLTGIVTHIVGDTTPQLGGNLDGNSKSIYGVGILTATQIADSNGSVGSASSVLSSTGSGLSWVSNSSGGGGSSNVSVANQADNRLVAATGTTDALNAEANLTFDGTTFKVGTAITASAGIITATTFSGTLDGNATYAGTAGIATYAGTAGVATDAQGLTGTPNISCGTIGGSTGTFTGLLKVNLSAGLGENEDDEVDIAEFDNNANAAGTANALKLLIQNIRIADGNDWTTTATRIQRRVDSTDMGYIDFGTGSGGSGRDIQFGNGNGTIMMHLDNTGNVGINSTSPKSNLDILDNTSANDTPEIRIDSFRPAIRFADRSNSQASAEICGDDSMQFRVSVEADNDTALTERLRIGSSGQIGLGGAVYGTTGQVLTSNGESGAVSWEDNTLDGVLGRGNSSDNGIDVGISTLGNVSSGFVKLYNNSNLVFQTVGTGVSVSNAGLNTATIFGPQEIHIDPHPVGVATTSGIVRIKGDLYVDGKNFIVDSETITLGDFVVGIASTATTDALADGAGLLIGPDNTFKYEYNSGTNPSLKSSENLNVATGKVYQIAETEVLSSDTLSVGTGATVHSPSSNVITLGTNDEERLRISSSGKVGIGITIPDVPLHIYGSSDTAPILAFTRSTVHGDWQGAGIGMVDEGGTFKGALTFYTHGSSGTKNDSVTERLRIASTGRVSIGNATNNASPTALFGVKADDGEAADLYVGQFDNLEATDGQSYGVAIRAGSNSTDHGLRVKNRDNDTTQFLVRGDGKVGINTTTLTEQLEVDGDIRVRNAIKFREDNGTETGNISLTDDDNLTIQSYGTSGHITFDTGSSAAERVRIDSSGRILKGITTARGNFGNNTSGVEYAVQVEGTSAIEAGLSIIRNSNDANDGGIILGKTRSATNGVATPTVVDAGDDLGTITWAGSDGTTMLFGAEMLAEVQTGVGDDDLPTDLIFKTNGGSTSTAERLRITSEGNVTTTGDSTFSRGDAGFTARKGDCVSITRANGTPLEITRTTAQGNMINFFDTDATTQRANIQLNSNDLVFGLTAEKLRITSDGKLLVNHTASVGSAKIQSFTSNSDAIDIAAYSTTAANGGRLTFYRSKNATIGSNTEVADSDSLGRIDWRGYNDDGTAFNIGATIEAEVDGAVDSTTDMPSALVFKTSADGSSTPTERLRITSAGAWGLAGTNYGSSGQVLTSNGSASAPTWQDSSGGGGGGGSSLWESNATGINTSTNVGIGTTTVSDAAFLVDVGTASTAVVVQGSEGQLFSVTNSLSSGSIFSVNDISGIPSIDVDADGTIQLSPYSTTENIGLGITNPSSKLHVVGGTKITGVLTTGQIADSNGAVGAASSVLSSTGSGLSWVANSGGISNVVEDTSPQLGGNLDINSKYITGTGGISITGVTTSTDFNSTSDIRLKTNIKPIDDPLAKVIQIEGVSFNWKQDNRPALGVIADQVEKILPQLVHGDDPKTVNYNGLIGLLIEAVKEQQTQIDNLNERLSKLE